ncbi:hypothetical protein PP639_gp090 [Arthrobacter phage Seahorse]|uniref:Uncharacterized protein n=1 Tax=Arthrobacter phage Seahorse TaxID=2419611 RepID=A0A3G3M501_9CAUD|nr:hypothetical protein PP639_gp090 [Arthrobacter phage Seahorse]AYR01590.1 hypothetical protein PBI_SEAHORSE_90 [Arthrobacter phage Seahorse]
MSSDFAATKAVTARKQHDCDECGRIITPGETYDRTAGSWEGGFFTNVACVHCAALRRRVNRVDDGYFESYYGGLSWWVGEVGWHPAEIPGPNWEARLALYRMARHFKDRWRDHSGNLRPTPPDQVPIPQHANHEAVPTGAASVIPTTEQDTK